METQNVVAPLKGPALALYQILSHPVYRKAGISFPTYWRDGWEYFGKAVARIRHPEYG